MPGFVPRLPGSLEQLDFLLPIERRRVYRYGIRFENLVYSHPALHAHIGESVMIRYDP